jgi:hypothetical protein
MNLDLHLRLIGLSLVLLALVHATFPKRFNWNEELPKLTLINRQMFEVHCFFIALTLFLMGVLCLAFPGALTSSSQLGCVVSAGLMIYWLCRLFCQFFVYHSSLWWHKGVETLVHVVFGFLWLYYVAIFGWNFLRQLGVNLG